MFKALSLFKVGRVAKAAEPVKTLAVVEKKSILASTALGVGGGIVKTTALVGGIGLVGAGAQEFKNSLFSGLGNIANGGLGSISSGLGSLGGLGDALGSASTDLMSGLIIVGGVVAVGVLYKVLKK